VRRKTRSPAKSPLLFVCPCGQRQYGVLPMMSLDLRSSPPFKGKTGSTSKTDSSPPLTAYASNTPEVNLSNPTLMYGTGLHLARKNPLGTVCEFKGGTFLKAIGRSTGKKDYQWLDRVFSRLTACEVRFERSGFTHGRGLIASYDIDDNSRLYRLCIDPDMAKLYRAGWSAIDWQQRQALRRKPLALWLHGYNATHAKPLPVKVNTLRTLSGSKTKTLYHFRSALRQALNELKTIGAIASWKIDSSDLVVVDRGEALTESQKRSLSRRLSVMSRKNKRRLTPQSRVL